MTGWPIQPTFHDCGTVYHTDLLTLCGELARRGMQADCILMDLPYSTTQNEWDELIPFPDLWRGLRRIVKPGGAIVLTASQPFTSKLVCSNLAMFRYEWIWRKSQSTGFLDANRKPMKQHESVLVFCDQDAPYYPQMQAGTPYRVLPNGKSNGKASNYGKFERVATVNESGERYPKTVIDFDIEVGMHPTQKPVDLFRYLIRTYTRPGELVFDGTCGSGTTAIAAREEGRRFIVGDSSEEYIAVTRKRLDEPYTPSFLPALEAVS